MEFTLSVGELGGRVSREEDPGCLAGLCLQKEDPGKEGPPPEYRGVNSHHTRRW